MSTPEQDPNARPQRTFAGMPVSWDWNHRYKGMWNAPTVPPPKRVGIGWTINFRELLRRLRVVG
jgi:hypothetical protein